MAVPGSGALNMLNMAREALYGTWGSGIITGPISLYDMVNGGQANGSGNNYPAINQGCTPNPADRSTYNSFTVYSGGSTVTLYTTVALTSVTTGTIIYSSASGTVYTGGGAFIATPTNIIWFGCSGTIAQGSCPAFSSNTSTGAITSTGCSCP
jgi:hypothetical protein